MKVLLCTPYEEGKEIVFGGVTIWARNIINYYKTIDKGPVLVDVQPFDRITYVSKDMSKYARFYYGISEYLKMIKGAEQTLKKNKYDIVHLNSSANISLFKDLLMIRKAHCYGAKIALHLHFGRIPQIICKKNWEWKILRVILNHADMVITMDQRSFFKLNDMGYNNVSYLPNPLSLAITTQIQEENTRIFKATKSILFVGHVILAKGVFELAEATKGMDYSTLRFIGKCPDDTKQKLLAINPNIIFVGEVPHNQVIKEILASDIMVLPSYTEGFPNVILEGMACRCAIVATTVGAIPEMLDVGTQKPCGMTVAPRDTDALRDALSTLLSDEGLRNVFRERAVKRVHKMYSVKEVWGQLTGIWKSMIAN